jgi:phenylalanyl-tRNA synthetase alpha subunit
LPTLNKRFIFYQRDVWKVKNRLRPSYFPFTEPVLKLILGFKTETDYRITKGTGWLEIMGCGMVDPNVLKTVVSILKNTTVLLLNGNRKNCHVAVPNWRYSYVL